MASQKEELLFIGFNQDNKLFSVGTSIGFRIYSTEPFKLKINRGKYNKFIILLYISIGL